MACKLTRCCIRVVALKVVGVAVVVVMSVVVGGRFRLEKVAFRY